MRTLASFLPVFVALTLALFPGCSVKEDRGPCPCIVKIDLSTAFDNSDGSLLLVLWNESGFRFCDTLLKSEFSDTVAEYSASVPRGKVMMDVYSPAGVVSEPFEGYRPDGVCAPIWIHSGSFDAEGEYVRTSISLSKGYCGLSVSFKGETAGWNSCSLVFRSEVDGYLPGGGLSPGSYSEMCWADSTGSFGINLLRQKDASLMMDIVAGSGLNAGKVLRTVAIGEYIAASGYDWTEENLEDLEIEVDFANMRVGMRTAGRDRTVLIDFAV